MHNSDGPHEPQLRTEMERGPSPRSSSKAGSACCGLGAATKGLSMVNGRRGRRSVGLSVLPAGTSVNGPEPTARSAPERKHAPFLCRPAASSVYRLAAACAPPVRVRPRMVHRSRERELGALAAYWNQARGGLRPCSAASKLLWG